MYVDPLTAFVWTPAGQAAMATLFAAGAACVVYFKLVRVRP